MPPEGWEEVRLADVCRFLNGRAYNKDELLSSGKYPVLRVGNFFTNDKWYYSDLDLEENKYCDNGDLLYAWSASFGPKIWNGGKVIYHYHIWKLEICPGYIDRDFLYYFLEWDVRNVKASEGSGSTMIHVTKGAIERRLVKRPPLLEQQRIAEVLRAMDEAIEAGTEAYEQTCIAFAATRTSLTGLDKANPDWTRGPILDFFQLQRGHDLPVQNRIVGAVPVIASNGTVGFHNFSPVSAPSVVTGRSGTIGKVNFFDGACWPLNTTLFVKDFKGSNPRYVYHFLSAFPLGDYQTGTGVPTLNRNDVHVVEVSWPDRGEQDDIVAALDALESVVITMKQELDALRSLKSQVADDLLCGRVRVSA